MKLWGGRFQTETHHTAEEFLASIHFDQCLWKVDILGSLAYVKALEKAELLNNKEAKLISDGLHLISKKIMANEIEFSAADEDVHMNIERLLFNEIGEVAGKLHAGRSRNDQVATDMHLYLREQLLATVENIHDLQVILIQQAEKHLDTIMPGYTHLQPAQPIRFAQHLLAYVAMLQRDVDRLIASWSRINIMPLGAGAIAGNGFNIDRDYLVEILHFDGIYENSMDAVSDRDFIIEYLSNMALIMLHLSRFSEEIILWTTAEFSFIEIDDAFCTGSSMMPQKKNPDVAELVRGKTGRVYGALMGLLTTLKGLPLAYNKDLQEDKELLFDTVRTVNQSLKIYAVMWASIKINKENMLKAVEKSFACATALANFLVQKGVPFREAHKIIGNMVSYANQHNLLLIEFSLHKFQEFSPFFDEAALQLLFAENVVEASQVKGGTSKQSVVQQIKQANAKLLQDKQWVSKMKIKIDPFSQSLLWEKVARSAG